MISLIGTVIVFRTNARGDNRHFIERWLCLHFSLSLLVICVPQFLLYGIYVVLYWSYGSAIILLFQKLYWPLLSFNLFLLVVEFSLLNHFIRIAASGSSPDNDEVFAPIASP